MKIEKQINMKKSDIISRNKSLITIVIAFLLLMPAVTVIVKADDIIVDDDGTGDYTSIQDAINNAADGDTIWVKAGSYNDVLTINLDDLTIRADDGATPILYLTSAAPGIDIQGNRAVIEGFEIYGNSAPGGGPTIRATSVANDTTIRQNIFRTLTGETGNTALLVQTGATDIEFIDNSITAYYQGVSLEDGTDLYISGNTFTHCNYSIYHGATIEGSSTWYGSIQEVIDLSVDGETVAIVPGPFEENLQINKSITLKGAQSSFNPVGGRVGEETIIDGDTTTPLTIIQNTSDVVIEGITFSMPNKAASIQAGIFLQEGSNDIIIQNCIIDNITDGSGADTTSDTTYGILIEGKNDSLGGQRNIEIRNNVIQNVEEYGIGITENTSHVIINGNEIVDLIGSDHSAEGLPWDPSWPDIICSAVYLGGEVGPIHNITIEDNTLSTNVMGDGGTSAEGNAISFTGLDESAAPNRIWQGFNDIYISYNKMIFNSFGLLVLEGNTSGEITVHNAVYDDNGNNITNNTVAGIQNNVIDAFVNATNNWWGYISGPYNVSDNPLGTGDNVSGNVSFWPWSEFASSTGKSGFSVPPNVDYDIEGPQINFGEIIKVSTEIEINADDSESGIFSLTYRIWNTTHRWGPWINYTEPFSLTSQGNHRVQVNATDFAGTSTYNGPYVYHEHRVDDRAPEVTVLYPNGGEFEYDTIPISWTAADKIFDQGQLTYNNSISLTEDYPGHIQSFIPTEDSIDSVQFLLSGDDANVSVKLFSSISPVPNIIAQSKIHLQNIGSESNPIWIDFPFSSSVDLDTNQEYYIGITQEIYGDIGFRCYYHNDSTIEKYPNGQAWIKEIDTLTSIPTMDYAFKTMYWNNNVDITVQYSNTGVSPWSTIAEGELNDGLYNWDTATYGIPDGPNYRVQIVCNDEILNLGFDASDEKFIIDNEGPGIYDIVVTDTTIDDTSFTKHGDNIEITATIGGDPVTITADLSNFGKGLEVPPTSFTGGIAKWTITDIICYPADGPVTFTLTAIDGTGDSGSNYGSIIADNTDPSIEITKPGAGLYFLDSMRLLPFSYPFIIGQITFETEVSDTGSGIEQVEFYLENELKANVSEAPYRWLWDRSATGFFDVEVKTIDRVGHIGTAEITDLFIINLDIIGHS